MNEITNDPLSVKFDKNKNTVLFVLRDNGGCGFYRCAQPALALRDRRLMNTITDLVKTTKEHVEMADVVVIQSPGSLESLEAFKMAKELRKPIIVEIDDFVHSISPHNPGYAAWNPTTLYLSRYVKCMQEADAMIVSTPQLAREYFPFNKKIYVVPNYLSKDKWDHPAISREDGLIRIGWAGGNAHKDDLAMISPVIQRIVKEYEGKVKFETMGMQKFELSGVFPMEEFLDKCPKCEYQGELTTHGGEGLGTYPAVLASHAWDIGLAPVVDTAFNNAKSDLKLKEYSAIGLPMIASSVTPYEEAKRDGCVVELARTHDEWYNKIKQLIENKEERREIAKKNKEWVGKYWIDDNVFKYQEIFDQVINSRSLTTK